MLVGCSLLVDIEAERVEHLFWLQNISAKLEQTFKFSISHINSWASLNYLATSPLIPQHQTLVLCTEEKCKLMSCGFCPTAALMFSFEQTAAFSRQIAGNYPFYSSSAAHKLCIMKIIKCNKYVNKNNIVKFYFKEKEIKSLMTPFYDAVGSSIRGKPIDKKACANRFPRCFLALSKFPIRFSSW